MDHFEFNFDYNTSYLDLPTLLQTFGITREEIISAIENPKMRLHEVEGDKPTIYLATAYSSNKRIIRVAFTHPKLTLDILDVKIAEEDDIERYFCG
ncbi:MAG: hypothetical protein ACFB0B_01780 [Thermonemataceae bacterium]